MFKLLVLGLFFSLDFSILRADQSLFVNQQDFIYKIQGMVINVYDGDTLLIQDENGKHHKVRLLGIDAPEISQDYGLNAKEELQKEVYKKDVIIYSNGRDIFKRILGKVMLNNININLLQIKKGYAWYYEDKYDKRDGMLYSKAELDARNQKIGLWQGDNPVRPSEFRKKI